MNIFSRKEKEVEGFSLIELVVVVAVLSALSAIAIPSFSCFTRKAKAVAALNAIRQIKNEAEKDIKNASVKIAIESVEKLIKNSLDKSKLDKIYSSSVEETKLALKKKSS